MLKLAIISNNISYISFRNEFIKFQVFATRDIKKIFPNFDSKRLHEWQRKGYIEKIINKWYRFTEIPGSELLQFRISNCILSPSYISLESALSYYGFIPETAYSTVAVTTQKTIEYKPKAGSFSYRVIKPGYYFGYQIIYLQQLPVLIADREKSILDFLYLNSHLNSAEDIDAVRFNFEAISDQIDWNKMQLYLSLFNSPTLNKRMRVFKKIQLYVTNK